MRDEIKALLEREARDGFEALHVDEMRALRDAFHAGEIPRYRFAFSWCAPHVLQKRLHSDGERYTLEDAQRVVARARARTDVYGFVVEQEPTVTWVNRDLGALS